MSRVIWERWKRMFDDDDALTVDKAISQREVGKDGSDPR